MRILILAYLGLVLLMGLTQRQMLYYPQKLNETSALSAAERFKLEPVRDGEGEIFAWRTTYSEEPPENRIIYFHGNAGHALGRTYFSELFGLSENGDRWEVFLFEYPGYGPRRGSPSQSAILESAHELIAGLLAEDDRPLYLGGESLGSCVATLQAAEFPDQTAGLLLVTPFTSTVDVGKRHFPWLPVGLLLRDRFPADQALRDYEGPVAFVIAGRDEVVPADLGHKLADGYHGPKEIWEQPDSGHNTLDYSDFWPGWQEIEAFLLEN